VRILVRALVLTLAAAWIYYPSLHGTWLWDDGLEVTQNLALRAPDGWWQPWVHPAGMDYFPLKGSLQWVEWRLWGADPLGYHLSNVALHVASSLLVWRLLHRLGLGSAYLGGLLFAVHPLAVESVAWISEFKNTVSLPFLLLASLAHVEFDLSRRRWPWALSILWFIAALACKTSVVMFPLVILLYAWWRRSRVEPRDVLDAAPLFAASLALGGATYWFQSHRAIGIAGSPVPLGARLAQAGWSVMAYVRQSIVPAGLAPIYAPGNAGPWAVLPWIGMAAVGAWFWARRTGWGRNALLGSGWFIANLLPALGLLPMAYMRISPRADHFAYVSLVGCVGLAAAAAGSLRRSPLPWPVVPTAAALVVGLFAMESRVYASVFRDERALWTYAIAQDPAAWLARNNLGKVLLQDGDSAGAAEQFAKAAQLQPDSPEAHANLGNALDAMGQHSAAELEFARALKIDPGFAGGHYDLGLSLLRAGRTAVAAGEFRAAIALDPAHAQAHNNLGVALARAGLTAEATGEYRAALHLDPNLAEAHLNLGNVLFRAGRLEEAVAEYREALRINPGYAGAHNNLGYALKQLGRDSEGDAELKAAGASANH